MATVAVIAVLCTIALAVHSQDLFSLAAGQRKLDKGNHIDHLEKHLTIEEGPCM